MSQRLYFYLIFDPNNQPRLIPREQERLQYHVAERIRISVANRDKFDFPAASQRVKLVYLEPIFSLLHEDVEESREGFMLCEGVVKNILRTLKEQGQYEGELLP